MDIDRFVAAQATHYDAALRELAQGAKRTHWMWFVFPQLAGLGHSATARHYAIHDLDEARAYLAHPLLGTRYRECTAALAAHRGRSIAAILGATDAMKLRSSLTLFDRAGAPAIVADTLAAFFDAPDDATLRLLGARL
jgi:uncharacterized protein (DUF1810 family)